MNTLPRQPEETFIDWAERFLDDADNRRNRRSRLLHMPVREQFEFSDSDPRSAECQVRTQSLKPWQFYLIAASDLIAVAFIVWGIVRAVSE